MKIHNFYRCFALAALIALLTACVSSPPRTLDTNSRQKIKSIAVVSVAGQTFTRKYTGLTLFNNENEGVLIRQLGLDEQYENQMQIAIAALGPFKTEAGSFNRSDLYSTLNRDGIAGTELSPTAKTLVRTYAQEKNVDAVLILTSATTGDFLSRTNQSFSGAGTYATFRPGLSTTVLHLIAAVYLIDGKTGDVLASAGLLKPNADRPSTAKMIFFPGRSIALADLPPYVPFDETLARTPLDSWKQEDIKRIQSVLTELPKPYWEPTLRKLLLGENPQQPEKAS